jgi:hypothetical protein
MHMEAVALMESDYGIVAAAQHNADEQDRIERIFDADRKETKEKLSKYA